MKKFLISILCLITICCTLVFATACDFNSSDDGTGDNQDQVQTPGGEDDNNDDDDQDTGDDNTDNDDNQGGGNDNPGGNDNQGGGNDNQGGDNTDEPPHEHTFADEWSKDETHHWYASTCGHTETEEKIEHDFENEVCVECGYDSHKHTFADEWSKDETYHWYASTCGHSEAEEKIAHDFENGVCKECQINYCAQGLEYYIYDNEDAYTVTGIGTCLDENLTIYPEHNGKPVIRIGWSAFRNCNNLRSVLIPDSVKEIHNFAFQGCSQLEKIELPATIIEVGEYVFDGCESLIYYEKDGLKYLGNEDNKYVYLAGVVKTDILNADIHTSCKLIGFEAFKNCTLLNNIRIPSGVTHIGVFATSGSFKNIEVEESNANYKSINGNLYTKDGKELIQYARGKVDDVFSVPDGVTIIGKNAFVYCNSLLEVYLPNSVISLGDGCFSFCNSLVNIHLSENLTEIGENAFVGCAVKSVTIPNGVVSIGRSAFSFCNSLETVKIGVSLKNITGEVFEYSSLKNIEIDKENEYFTCIDGNLYSKDGKILVLYAAGKISTRFEIPHGVSSIGVSAFGKNVSLTHIYIPKTLKRIDNGAFLDLIALENIAFEGTIEEWNEIEKYSGWNNGVPATKVICSDGEVAI